MLKKFDVIGLGANTIDHLISLPHLPLHNLPTVCLPQNYRLIPGGSMGNTLSALSRLGLRTGYLGKVGGDRLGIMLKQVCVREGIDLSECEIIPDQHTAWNWRCVDMEDKRMSILFPNVLADIDEPYIEANASYLKACRMLHIEASALLLSPLLLAAEIAKADDIPVVCKLNLSPSVLIQDLALGTQEELEEMLSFSDVLIIPAECAGELTDQEELIDMAKELRENYLTSYVVMTSQEQGCVIASDSESFRLPLFNVISVDPSGSDDAFTAGIVFGIFHEWDIREIARFANACQTVSLLQKGTRESLGTEADIRGFLAKHPLPE